jgi:pantoate--beta-alanine ligase
VVAKLFNITGPDIAYFGQKDAQQAVIIQRMASDLNFGLKIKVMPTIREKGGLALSSRNKYLNSREKEGSMVLFRSLNIARDLIGQGERECREIILRMKALINSQGNARIDYVNIVDPENLKPLGKIQKKCLIALAVRFGSTRLIDNAVIRCKG